MDPHPSSDPALVRQQMELYEATVRPIRSWHRRAARAAWTAGGLGILLGLGWAEPWSERWFLRLLERGADPAVVRWLLTPLVYALRAILLVEAFGYAYHRFFQHVGWLTRQAQVFRRNQMFHWIHHMVIYPIGRFYRRSAGYVSSETGIAWSWVAPALAALAAALATHGFTVGGIVFVATIALYAKLVIDTTHARFHQTEHPWVRRPYFHWLEQIHVLHHWDQRANFTIVHPAMDWLFGTYLSPATHARELEIALRDEELTASDLINWRYLLIEATPAEYAAFISQARRHPRSVRKLSQLRRLLAVRADRTPNDVLARKLQARAENLWRLVGPEIAAKNG